MALGSGSSLSVTLERTGGLGDLTAVIDLPAAGLSEVEHDETLLGVGTTADPLGVSVHDVIEQFAESVKYFTTSTSLNTGNFAAKGAALFHRQSRIPPHGSRDGIQPRQRGVFRARSPAGRYDLGNCRCAGVFASLSRHRNLHHQEDEVLAERAYPGELSHSHHVDPASCRRERHRAWFRGGGLA